LSGFHCYLHISIKINCLQHINKLKINKQKNPEIAYCWSNIFNRAFKGDFAWKPLNQHFKTADWTIYMKDLGLFPRTDKN